MVVLNAFHKFTSAENEKNCEEMYEYIEILDEFLKRFFKCYLC